MKKLIKLLNNYIKNYRIEIRKNIKNLQSLFPLLEQRRNIMNKDYKNMSDLEKEQVTQYIGIQCSSFTTNSYWVRVSSQDTERHLRKEIDIFELQKHLSDPTLDSPSDIYLGGIHFILDKLNLTYSIYRNI